MAKKMDPQLTQEMKVLGQILGDCVRRTRGEPTLRRIETARVLSKKARAGDLSAGKRLQKQISQASGVEMATLAKAFCEFMRISNTAEQVHRLRSLEAQKVSSADRFAGVIQELGLDRSKTRLRTFLNELEIDLVLTAHPTEAMPSLTRRACRVLAEGLKQQDESKLVRSIETLWASEAVSLEKPTPLEEAMTNFSIVEESLWESVPRAARLCEDVLGEAMPPTWSPFRFSSWMGGDRDGNPFVNARMTRAIRREARRMGLGLFEKDLRKLKKELDLPVLSSSKNPDSSAAQILDRWVERIHAEIVDLSKGRSSKNSLDERDLQKDLLGFHKILCKSGFSSLAGGPLTETLRRLSVFGFGLFRMDLRQSSDIHESIINDLLKSTGVIYSDLSEDEKIQFLLKTPRISPKKLRLSPEGRDFRDLCQDVIGENSQPYNCLIVSMTEEASDLLEAIWLQKAFGVKKLLPVVPLFETPEALEKSVSIMSQFWRAQRRGSRQQQVMLGYSDSTKRGGLLASAWTLHRVQREIEAEAHRQKVEVVFFHGRGGSIGRGGGPVRKALQSLPLGTHLQKLRITEQGESIESKYGLPEIALRTFELYLMAVLEARFHKPSRKRDEWSKIMDQMGEVSQKSFRAFIYENERFGSFFEQVTPVSELGVLKIGSRPSRRKKSADLESLRAIPWIFSWTQNRALLASWLGAGKALSQALSLHGEKRIHEMYRDWAFFQSVTDLLEMVLAKADMKTFALYAELLLPENQQSEAIQVVKEYNRTARAVQRVLGVRHLLSGHASLRESIEIRSRYVEVLNRLQIEVLRRHRRGKKSQALERALALTISGIAAGMRNTG